MKLLTNTILSQFDKYGSQQKVEDPIVVAKFFNPAGAGYWFATEYDEDEKMFFGYVSIFNDHNNEFGYFSLEELESIKGMFGLGIERDTSFEPTPLSEVKRRNRIN